MSEELRPPEPGRQAQPSRWSMASGVVVGEAKVILTNAHALHPGGRVLIQVQERALLSAKVLAHDPRVDLALLEIQDDKREILQQLRAIEWSEEPPVPGQWAICMGHPYGLGHTLTVGVVSGLGRDYEDMGRPPGLSSKGWWSMMQVDAAINLGNSGGPIVDENGNVLGIATATRSDGHGLAFAVPAPMARHFVEEVLEHGQMRSARLGARVQERRGDVVPGRLHSLEVIQVEAGGPADRAGLRVGDIILRAGERDLHRLSALLYEVQRRGVGRELTLWVHSPHRGAPDPRSLQVQLEARR